MKPSSMLIPGAKWRLKGIYKNDERTPPRNLITIVDIKNNKDDCSYVYFNKMSYLNTSHVYELSKYDFLNTYEPDMLRIKDIVGGYTYSVTYGLKLSEEAIKTLDEMIPRNSSFVHVNNEDIENGTCELIYYMPSVRELMNDQLFSDADMLALSTVETTCLEIG